MHTNFLSEWLDDHIWPEIRTMMLNDAYFKLIGRVRELTGKFNGPAAGLIEVGYVASQTLAIRRLCDGGRDVISLRRALMEAKAKNLVPAVQIDPLLGQLDTCDHICRLVNNYIAHTTNPLRGPNRRGWNLQVGHLTEAQKAICKVTIVLDRDLRGKNYLTLIPVPQFNIMEEFTHCVPDAAVKELWEFWHDHNDSVNAWL